MSRLYIDLSDNPTNDNKPSKKGCRVYQLIDITKQMINSPKKKGRILKKTEPPATIIQKPAPVVTPPTP